MTWLLPKDRKLYLSSEQQDKYASFIKEETQLMVLDEQLEAL